MKDLFLILCDWPPEAFIYTVKRNLFPQKESDKTAIKARLKKIHYKAKNRRKPNLFPWSFLSRSANRP